MSQKFRNWQLIAWFPELNKLKFAGLLKFFRFDMLVAQMYMYIRKTISAVRRDDLLMRLGYFYLSSPIKV